MFGTQNLPVFVMAGLLLNVTPGQDTLYILGRSIAQGRRAGVASVLGISTGCLFHTTLAAVGLAAVLRTSAVALDIVRCAGAAYLVWLGMRMALDRTRSADAARPQEFQPQSALRIYAQGVITNVLNPKVALFFLAFLPQFIDPASHSKAAPLFFLGALFTFNGTMWCLLLACSASAVVRRARRNRQNAGLLKQTTGAVFMALGVKMAASR